MPKFLLAMGLVFLTATVASGQTKVSGIEACSKPEPQYVIPVSDSADHLISIAQWKCTWPEHTEIEGVPIQESVITGFYDLEGSSAKATGYDVDTLVTGERAHVRYKGTARFEEGAWRGEEGTWTFFGGTGKLTGIEGKGTYECKPTAKGLACDIEGEYTLPDQGE